MTDKVKNLGGRPKKLSIRQEKIKKELFLEKLENNLGVITPTINAVGITRFFYDKWLREDEEFKAEVELIREKTLDYVESKLFKLINEGDKAAVMFYLKCKGKDRGYIERQEIQQEITYREPLKINVIVPNQQNQLED